MQTIPSLDQFHDVVTPPRISWWPLADGWYVVALIVLVVVVASMFRWHSHWRKNAYRRKALQEWQYISSSTTGREQLQALAMLLKRTALAAFPRQQVASLCNRDWLQFLDRTAGLTVFENGPAQVLVTSTYDPRMTQCDSAAVEAVRNWIVQHRVA